VCLGKRSALYRTRVEARKPCSNRFFAIRSKGGEFDKLGSRGVAFDRGGLVSPAAHVRLTIDQITNIATDWRWVTGLVVALVLVGLLISMSKRRVRHSALPQSLFRRNRAVSTDGEEYLQGPSGGRIVRLNETPGRGPGSGAVASGDHQRMPISEQHASAASLWSSQDDPIVTIDLTELESEPEAAPVVIMRDDFIDLTIEERSAALPADPWG